MKGGVCKKEGGVGGRGGGGLGKKSMVVNLSQSYFD